MAFISKEQTWFETEKTIREYELSLSGFLGIAELQRLLQDAGTQHHNFLGYDRKKMIELDFAYLINSLSLRMDREIVGDEKIYIHTAGLPPKGIRLYRDYKILDFEKKLIGVASSAWASVDMRTHTLLGEDDDRIRYKSLESSELDIAPAKKIRLNKAAVKTSEREIKNSDIDFLGHMTNSKYTDVFFDEIAVDPVKYMAVTYEINYRKEAMKGERFDILTEVLAQEDGSISAYLHGEVAGETRFICKAKFVERTLKP